MISNNNFLVLDKNQMEAINGGSLSVGAICLICIGAFLLFQPL